MIEDREDLAPSVSVVVPARNAELTIGRTLMALQRQELADPSEVIVVDDGSRDGTAAIVERHRSFARVIRSECSEGASAARNRGALAARAPLLAFTDADCFPTRCWLARGLEKSASAELVQGRVQPDPVIPRSPFDRTLSVEADNGFYQTANLFVRREIFDAVGGFTDWARGPRGGSGSFHGSRRARASQRPVGEDTLFAWRARRLGASTVFAPEALVYHAVFRGDLLDAIADRWHWATLMPRLTRLVPELRDTTFYHRRFFADWTAKFDLAVAGLATAGLTRNALWLAGAIPYLQCIRHQAMGYRVGPGSRVTRISRAALHALGQPAVDAATLAGLMTGSVTSRCVVL